MVSLSVGNIQGDPIKNKNKKPKGINKEIEKKLNWDFPIQRCHAGIPMGNGRQGLLIWGSDSVLKITIAHAGFWDRRWDKEMDTSIRYRKLVPLIKKKDEAAIRDLFTIENQDKLKRPRQIGGALIEIPLPSGWHLHKASLSLTEGKCAIFIRKKGLPEFRIEVEQFIEQNTARIQFPLLFHKYLKPIIKPVSDFLATDFQNLEISPASTWQEEVPRFSAIGIVQSLPQDPALGIMCAWKDKNIWLTSGIGPESSKGALLGKLENFPVQSAEKQTKLYWGNFWRSCPKLEIPDERLMELYDFGLYKMAVSTHPNGPALSLQGPFMEHYQLPPWSNDYHFNVNVQMAYLPFLSTGQYASMMPLWKMIQSWFPAMKKNGEHYFEKPGALFLPHASTDEGKWFGNFWAGMIDQGSLAWMSQLAWKYYKHTHDKEFLKDIAFPMLEGAYLGYETQLDTIQSGAMFHLGFPVSVSPEFKGTRMDAWGRNSSFQLAAFHMLIQNLSEARIELGMEIPTSYSDFQKKVAPFELVKTSATLEYPENKSMKIGLWEDMDLIESHRHHSHMASVYPFETINPLDSANLIIFTNTYYNWSRKGTGAWAGWSVPWASILLSRFNQVNSSISMIHWGKENFINEGRGTLHDAFYPYITTSKSNAVFGPEEINKGNSYKEIMQLDAGFGYVEAIHEILIQQRKDGLHIVPNIPLNWKDFRFDGIHTDDGLIVGATVVNGKVVEIRIRSSYAAKVRLVHNLEKWTVNGLKRKGNVLEENMGKDEIHIIKPIE